MKPSLFLAAFVMVLSLAAACVAAEKAAGIQEEPTPCYQLNNCREPATRTAKSAVECSAKGGASWKNQAGECIPDLDEDD